MNLTQKVKPIFNTRRYVMEVLVFKTNLRFKKQITALTPHINNLQGINRWNVDLDDKDKILRIESVDLCPRSVETTLQEAGYFCEELQ
jgi:copper chaperone